MENEFAGGHAYGYPMHAYNGIQSSPVFRHSANIHPSMNDHSARRPTSRGGRRLSPDELIPIDAPTQSRRYVTPSATSRKEVPAFFQKMRKQTPPEDEEDELTEEPPAANATDQEKIEWKRRQNTLAARRSRQRKLANLQRLEEDVKRLAKEKEIWRTRALTLRQLLISHGIICPEFQDD